MTNFATKNFLRAALLAGGCIAAMPAFAQLSVGTPPPDTTKPAPAPTVAVPPAGAAIAMPPLADRDATFVVTQIANNMAEIQAGQLALQRTQNPTVRNYAEKMINDYSAANASLMQIAGQHGVRTPMGLTPSDQDALNQLSQLQGKAFDRAYIDAMIRAHGAVVTQMNDELQHGLSQYVSGWVQNTRPTVIQHEQLAQQVRNYLITNNG